MFTNKDVVLLCAIFIQLLLLLYYFYFRISCSVSYVCAITVSHCIHVAFIHHIHISPSTLIVYTMYVYMEYYASLVFQEQCCISSRAPDTTNNTLPEHHANVYSIIIYLFLLNTKIKSLTL